jgi:hypothetical protein
MGLMYSEGLWELPTPRNLTLDRLGVNTPSLSGTSISYAPSLFSPAFDPPSPFPPAFEVQKQNADNPAET